MPVLSPEHQNGMVQCLRILVYMLYYLRDYLVFGLLAHGIELQHQAYIALSVFLVLAEQRLDCGER